MNHFLLCRKRIGCGRSVVTRCPMSRRFFVPSCPHPTCIRIEGTVRFRSDPIFLFGFQFSSTKQLQVSTQ